MTKRVGVMGGTFDPVHIGHLRVAEEAIEALGLDEMLFIPAAVPPHKLRSGILPFEHRFRMLMLALKDNPAFRLSDIELRLPGSSYSVNTLRKLSDELSGEPELYFLVGLDAFLEINTWWHYQELFGLANIVVLRRPGYDEGELGNFLHQKVSNSYTWDTDADGYKHPELRSVYYLRTTNLEISATRIRSLVRAGRSIRYMVMPEVLGYIIEEKLYLV